VVIRVEKNTYGGSKFFTLHLKGELVFPFPLSVDVKAEAGIVFWV